GHARADVVAQLFQVLIRVGIHRAGAGYSYQRLQCAVSRGRGNVVRHGSSGRRQRGQENRAQTGNRKTVSSHSQRLLSKPARYVVNPWKFAGGENKMDSDWAQTFFDALNPE